MPVDLHLSIRRQRQMCIRDRLWNALHGDFGNSYNTGRSIVEELVASIQPTLIMAVLALLFSTVICIPLGVLSASRKGGLADKSIYLFGIICMSLPNYWIGFMLLLAFAVYLPIFSIMGADSLKDFVLPALALAIPTLSLIHISEPTRQAEISYAVFCLKKKKKKKKKKK